MSHEIRTPMNGVIAASDLVLSEALPPKVERYVKPIHNSAYSLLGVINDILDFSKIEAGKLDMETRVFSLCDVLQRVMGMFSQRAISKGLEFIVDMDSEIPGTLVGDPLRLQQILKNLVDNAVKFTGKGGAVLVTVKQSELTSKEAFLSFSVKDFGIGISPEFLPKIFKPFTQEDTSSTRKYQGAGLGLGICRHLVELMHGRIGVESIKGKGTTFTFSARFKRDPDEQTAVFAFPKDIKGLRVLVVDDCEENKFVVQNVLQSFGCRVEGSIITGTPLQRCGTHTTKKT